MAKESKTSTLLKKLSTLPDNSLFDKHYWADYIELKCLFNKDNLFTQSDFIKKYVPRHKDLLEGFEGEDDDEITDDTDDLMAIEEIGDRNEIFAEDCFKLLEAREKLFEQYYPFKLSADSKTINLKNTITEKNKIYLFLLFSSTLRYTIPYKSELTSSFELFSLLTLKNFLPKKSEVHLFGSSNSLIARRKFAGTKLNKIKALAKALFTRPLVDDGDYSPNDMGDGGMDLVGWVSNGSKDEQPHIFTVTGQSACTENWDSKQYSSSYANWKNKIHFQVAPINFVFAPFCLRKQDDTWHKKGDIGDSVLIDRQRLIYHFNDNLKDFKNLSSYKVVEELLRVKESTFS